MLPQDPRLRGKLFQAARVLADWDQARLAGEAGWAPPQSAMEEALARAGVRFIPAIGAFGPGLRCTPPGRGEPSAAAPGDVRADAA